MPDSYWKNPENRSYAAVIAGLLLATICLAQAGDTNTPAPAVSSSVQEFKNMQFEDLFNISVSSLTRQSEPLQSSPSSIQVITQEDIRRSGATSVPEALRLASNLQVAQVDSHTWAISSRGFNSTTANKLQVLVDGRSIYTPLYSGVFWDVQDMMLENIDRIEVISGPAATVWGANAVNGVISISTMSARQTQGWLVSGGGGTQLNGLGSVRYGGQIGSNLFYRIYGTYFQRDDTVLPNGNDATNSWHKGQGGFRMDWDPGEQDLITFQGDGYGGSIEQTLASDTTVSGENLLSRWTHTISDESDLRLQAYWDRTWRRIPETFAEELNTYDLDFQHRFPIGQWNQFIYGAGYRLMADHVVNSSALAFLPEHRNLQLFSGFAQDEITLVPKRLKATIGTKLEHNDYSGFEVQPSLRLAWTPDENQTVWGAISRAVRTPSRIDRDFYVPGTPPYLLAGGTNFDSEKLLAYELGYRVRPVRKLTLSLSTFYNHYDDIRSLETVNGSSTYYLIDNGLEGESWGAELFGDFQPVDRWHLRGGYTYFHKNLWLKPGSTDLNKGTGEGDDPEHQFILQSMLDLPWHLELDATFRYVDRLSTPYVPSYFTCDVRLGWRPSRHWEFSIVGQNLWDEQHAEFSSSGTTQEIPRSVFGKVTWRF